MTTAAPNKPLTERDLEALAELEAHHANMANCGPSMKDRGARTLDVGGGSRSHHSQTLKKLAARGLVLRKKYGGERQKGSCLWWITDAGRQALRAAGRMSPEESRQRFEATMAERRLAREEARRIDT